MFEKSRERDGSDRSTSRRKPDLRCSPDAGENGGRVRNMRRERSTLEDDKPWYRTVLHTLPDAALLVKDGRCIDANAAAAEFFGVGGRDAISGQNLSRFLPPVQPGGGETIDARILDSMQGGPRQFTWQCRRADGTSFCAEVTVEAVRAEVPGVTLVLVRDPRRANRPPPIARSSSPMIRKNSLYVVLWSPGLRIRTVNKAFLQATGFERRTVESMRARDFESFDPTAWKIADVIRSRQTVVEEVHLDFPAGARTMLRFSAPIMDEEGSVVEILTVYRDHIP